jgi:protein gp37
LNGVQLELCDRDDDLPRRSADHHADHPHGRTSRLPDAGKMACFLSSPTHFPTGFTLLFHPERLSAPAADTRVPVDAAQDRRRQRVFVCSMSDLFGRRVPREWIVPILKSCSQNPQWGYLMLTKSPSRYLELLDLMPPTAWLGTSVDAQKRVRVAAEQAFRQISGVRNKLLCLEPMKEELRFSDLSMFDWIVIGSQTETRQPDGAVPAFAPPFEWVARIVAQAREAGCRVYPKPNLLGATNPQFGMVLPQDVP